MNCPMCGADHDVTGPAHTCIVNLGPAIFTPSRPNYPMRCKDCGGYFDSTKHQMTCVAPTLIDPRDAEIASLKLQNGLLKDALIELGVARAAWIHHCHAPEILKALWKVMEGSRVCSHKASEYGPGIVGPGETWTAPGVGAAGFSYCTCCGTKNPAEYMEKRKDESPTERPCCVEAYARGYEVGKAHGASHQ